MCGLRRYAWMSHSSCKFAEECERGGGETRTSLKTVPQCLSAYSTHCFTICMVSPNTWNCIHHLWMHHFSSLQLNAHLILTGIQTRVSADSLYSGKHTGFLPNGEVAFCDCSFCLVKYIQHGFEGFLNTSHNRVFVVVTDVCCLTNCYQKQSHYCSLVSKCLPC